MPEHSWQDSPERLGRAQARAVDPQRHPRRETIVLVKVRVYAVGLGARPEEGDREDPCGPSVSTRGHLVFSGAVQGEVDQVTIVETQSNRETHTAPVLS